MSGKIKVVDLFAGIGGLRIGFESIGAECVFSCELDKFARKTYEANFTPPTGHVFAGDITEVDAGQVPAHDVLLAGFPCQPFSISGISKRNHMGRLSGFEDRTRGTLFFDIAKILKEKQPQAFLLENVKNLQHHDKGKTFETIVRTLTDDLGYEVYHHIIDGQHFVPQRRNRVVIVGFKGANNFSWGDLRLPPKERQQLSSILQPDKEVDGKYVVTDRTLAGMEKHAARHKAAGNGFGYTVVQRNGIARTLPARYYKNGSDILIDRGEGNNPRRLTPRECARLMGFSDEFKIVVSDTQAYKQFGNSVVVPAIAEVARIMAPHLSTTKR